LVTTKTWPRVYELLKSELQGRKLRIHEPGCEQHRWPDEYLIHEIWCTDIIQRRTEFFKLTDLNERWPFEDDFFDVTVAVEVIEHLENPSHFLREVRRTTKAGGCLILTSPNPESPASRNLFLKTGRFHWFLEGNVEYGHITPCFIWQIKFLARKLGFVIEELRYDEENPQAINYQEIWVMKLRVKK